ncbi:TRAP-type mannitol/chloroaromatic compound transport system, small permease component [Hartmannibacter diazotrophicus]|uniref:TRAP transporter small permease protein n=1 Tax=Hartmannibacter diazotrophicus TaxID=1482074 RepID=A0A2C9DBM1_9HYPH|nr:TRAP transporter small permease subunit [Hartmannibacter diazotrophicus]SON57633.1 TRAP-type mannitol/chloroaromatic compound transport system, small permease component [Hartmannibacter diazotrophicus]
MPVLLRLSYLIDNINGFIGRSVSWLVLIAVLISAGNATMRKVFSVASNAWLEAQWYLFSAVFLLAAGYTLLKGEHVKIDIIYGHLQRRTQVWIEILGTLLFLFPFVGITFYLTLPQALNRITSGEVSNNAGGLMLWPVWILVPIGFALLGLQGASELFKRIAFLRGAGPDPAEGYGNGPH